MSISVLMLQRLEKLHVLKYLCDNGCPWGESTCTIAAKEGHLDILQWLHVNGYPWIINEKIERIYIHTAGMNRHILMQQRKATYIS